MNGVEWLDSLLQCEQARKKLPLELQATLPLPGRLHKDTAECWYYRMAYRPGAPEIYSPERWVLWDVRKMEILEMKRMEPGLLGSGSDLLTKAHRESEDAFLEGAFTGFLNGESAGWEEVRAEWLEAAPQAMRKWLTEAIEKEC